MSDRIIEQWPIYEIDAPEVTAMMPHAKCYQMAHARIILTEDENDDGTKLRHLSISCVDRDPTWQEIATARYRLLPGVPEMAMFLPPLNEYVNLHPFTFHLYEISRVL